MMLAGLAFFRRLCRLGDEKSAARSPTKLNAGVDMISMRVLLIPFISRTHGAHPPTLMYFTLTADLPNTLAGGEIKSKTGEALMLFSCEQGRKVFGKTAV